MGGYYTWQSQQFLEKRSSRIRNESGKRIAETDELEARTQFLKE